jgi:8-oxo-dGTP pyrophosphatase MutT (NUDIX family)
MTERPIRVSAKAIIIHNRQLLTIAKRDELGVYYILPGGGQQVGETLAEAVRRECIEEVSAEVEVGPLRFVRDYIAMHHEFADEEGRVHNLELMFLCHLRPGAVAAHGATPDDDQFDIAWLPVERLIEYRLYPQALRPLLGDVGNFNGPVYLGDVN